MGSGGRAQTTWLQIHAFLFDSANVRSPSKLFAIPTVGFSDSSGSNLNLAGMRVLTISTSVWVICSGSYRFFPCEVTESTRFVSLRAGLQDAEDKPLRGFGLADAMEQVGDGIERVVTWKSGSDVSQLSGKPVRLRFVMKDADLYSLRFR